jgi:hypothetical protein
MEEDSSKAQKDNNRQHVTNDATHRPTVQFVFMGNPVEHPSINNLTSTQSSSTSTTKSHLLKINSSNEFIAGYLSACTSITILFPFNKIIFRQILHGISFKDGLKQIKSEGFQKAYRGLLPPLLQKSTSYSIMFGTQNEYFLLLKSWSESSKSELIRSMNPNRLRISLTAISAGLAGLTEATLTPFERIQAILQMQQYHKRYRHSWDVFYDITKLHGVKELYRGYSAILFRNSCSNALFFTARTPLKSMFPHTTNQLQNTFYDFLSGGFLGAFLSTIFYPINVVKSHMQAKVGGDYLSMYRTFWIIYELRNRSLALLFKGVGSNFTRSIFSWGITNATYEFVLQLWSNKT